MNSRLKLLISIGGGPEAYAALAFAALLSRKQCADTLLLTVREPDSGMSSGGMELRVAREQILDWGLELPGLRRLKKARDIFAELGEISSDSQEHWEHRNLTGDPAGEYVVDYHTACGATVSLRLRSGTDVPGIIADECEREEVSLAIVGAPGETPTGLMRLVSAQPMAYRIARRVECPVIIARKLEAGHGILAVVNEHTDSLDRLPLLAWMSGCCDAPLKVVSACGEKGACAAHDQLDRFVKSGLGNIELLPGISADVESVLEAGKGMSLLVVSAPEGNLRGSLALEVAERADSSVMVLR